jgi:hypothetical protein
MYNTDFPDRADLPSTAKLLRSTAIAAVAAVAILITIVLPSEYGIDFTGTGRMFGLAEMGQIKMQLAAEAAAEETLTSQVASGTRPVTASAPVDPDLSARVDAIEQLLRSMQTETASEAPAALPAIAESGPVAAAASSAPAAEVAPVPAGPVWRDEVTFTLTPMEGTEYKLVMQAGAVATYEFVVDGGVINFDAHGEGEGQSLTYEEGRGVAGDTGQMIPPVAGTHGWFFRNRGTEDVVVTLRTGGDYQELRKLI